MSIGKVTLREPLGPAPRAPDPVVQTSRGPLLPTIDLMNFEGLRLLSFHVDWEDPGSSTLTGPIHLPVAPFTRASGSVPQLGTDRGLDTLGDRVMFRLAYRIFGDHESLVVNHSVQDATGIKGIRWYELQDPNGSPFIYQQGTFMPDATNRWMGSIAMDQAGDIALGYSASSSDIRPAIRYTGRTPDDLLGTLEDENATFWSQPNTIKRTVGIGPADRKLSVSKLRLQPLVSETSRRTLEISRAETRRSEALEISSSRGAGL